MPQSPSSSPSTSPEVSDDFGANEWLVEEMYERYRKDPRSVEPSWAAYFKANDNGGSDRSSTSGNNGSRSASRRRSPVDVGDEAGGRA